MGVRGVGRRVCWQASVCIGKREAGTARVLTATRFVCAMQDEGRGRLRWAFDVSMIKVVDGSDYGRWRRLVYACAGRIYSS